MKIFHRNELLDKTAMPSITIIFGGMEMGTKSSWKDYIVPYVPFSRNDIYVWVAYQNKPPYLPIAIASTADELSQKIGVSKNTIKSSWSRYVRGKSAKTKYHRVKVGLCPEDCVI